MKHIFLFIGSFIFLCKTYSMLDIIPNEIIDKHIIPYIIPDFVLSGPHEPAKNLYTLVCATGEKEHNLWKPVFPVMLINKRFYTIIMGIHHFYNQLINKMEFNTEQYILLDLFFMLKSPVHIDIPFYTWELCKTQKIQTTTIRISYNHTSKEKFIVSVTLFGNKIFINDTWEISFKPEPEDVLDDNVKRFVYILEYTINLLNTYSKKKSFTYTPTDNSINIANGRDVMFATYSFKKTQKIPGNDALVFCEMLKKCSVLQKENNTYV